MNSRFDISTMADLNQAIAYYTQNLLMQFSGLQKVETIKQWCDKNKIDFGRRETYFAWTEINVHCFQQMWPSTSCGWGGIGGSAMTTSYTVAIHNMEFGIIAVFWGGRLAYCIEDNEKAIEAMRNSNLPGYGELGKLNVIYKPTTRNNF